MPRVFISYATKDADFAEVIRNKLKEAHIEVWIDHDGLHLGDDWPGGIDEGILSSDVFLLVITPQSCQSLYVTYEWGFALGRGIRVLPLLREETKVPPRLEGLQHLDFRNPKISPWDELIQEIRTAKPEPRVVTERKDLWDRLRPLLDGTTVHQYSQTIPELLGIVRESVHTIQPVIRLWGNQGGLDKSRQEEFHEIGQQIGRCSAEIGFALSCSMLNANTLEYWALMGLKNAMSQHSPDSQSIFTTTVRNRPTLPVLQSNCSGSCLPRFAGSRSSIRSTTPSS